MTSQSVVDSLGQIVFGGVALTAAALDQATDGQELTFTQWRAILFTGETDGGRRVGEVAQRLMAGLSATSRLLRRLEDRGLVTLERDLLDRRATRARLTPAGRALRESVLAWRREQIAALVADLEVGPEAEATLARIGGRFGARGGAVGVQRVGRRDAARHSRRGSVEPDAPTGESLPGIEPAPNPISA